jgi:hypothetical protein
MRMQDSLSPALDVKYSTSIDSVIPGSYHRLTYEQDHGPPLPVTSGKTSIAQSRAKKVFYSRARSMATTSVAHLVMCTYREAKRWGEEGIDSDTGNRRH